MTGETRRVRNRLMGLLAAACSVAAGAAASGEQTAMTGSAPAAAGDPCASFAWNVTHERAVFATAAQAVTAASAGSGAPTIQVDKLYDIALTPQDKVSFVMSPAKKALADGAFAGIVTV